MSKTSKQFLDMRDEPEVINLPNKMNHSEMDRLAKMIASKVDEGEENALPIYFKIDFLIKALQKAMKAIKEQSLDEAGKYSKEDTLLDINFRTSEGKTMYDFSNNPEWVILNDKMKAIEKQMKSPHDVLGEGGEIIPKAVKTYSKASITITYKK